MLCNLLVMISFRMLQNSQLEFRGLNLYVAKVVEQIFTSSARNCSSSLIAIIHFKLQLRHNARRKLYFFESKDSSIHNINNHENPSSQAISILLRKMYPMK
ncbi:3691_t:CDS:2 [Funneliformis mosseae]|uniref:3691_t:CDS:1 n=1 Tax=Funneliformis mosseae TaxID=27381 RepID=A0A9N8VJP1_FUNMO|nr:3691_t:CDS:2 [Funneliformis mosseae]